MTTTTSAFSITHRRRTSAAPCARILPVMLVLGGSAPVYLGRRRVIAAWLRGERGRCRPADLVAARRLPQS
jgi:hypothetical protein